MYKFLSLILTTTCLTSVCFGMPTGTLPSEFFKTNSGLKIAKELLEVKAMNIANHNLSAKFTLPYPIAVNTSEHGSIFKTPTDSANIVDNIFKTQQTDNSYSTIDMYKTWKEVIDCDELYKLNIKLCDLKNQLEDRKLFGDRSRIFELEESKKINIGIIEVKIAMTEAEIKAIEKRLGLKDYDAETKEPKSSEQTSSLVSNVNTAEELLNLIEAQRTYHFK